MFRRWIYLIGVITLGSLLLTGVSMFYSHQRYTDYTDVLDECSAFEAPVRSGEVTEWTAQEEYWHNKTCDHGNTYSKASMKYSVYRAVSEKSDNYMTNSGYLILLVVTSFIGRWIYRGKARQKQQKG